MTRTERTELRLMALQFAIDICPQGDADSILAAARSFEAFLGGTAEGEERHEIEGATPIEALDLSVRNHNALKVGGYRTVADLREAGESGLLLTPYFGRKGLNELKRAGVWGRRGA